MSTCTQPTACYNPITAYVSFWKRYVLFSGRACRSEYWYVFLVNTIISLVLQALGDSDGGILGTLYGLATIIPSLALGARRLHDIGKSAWFLLMMFVPLVGAIVLLVMFCLPSEDGANHYGEGPLPPAN